MKIPAWLRKKRFYIPLILILVLIIWFGIIRGGEKEGFETKIAEAQTVTHVVSETGSVKPGQDISLSFARSGRVAKVLVEKGTTIYRGQVLAYLETGSLSADLRQAEAALELERASIEKTGVALKNAESSLINAITNAYITADDVVQAKADQLFINPESSTPDFGISITKGSTIFYINASSDKSDVIDSLRSDVEIELNNLESTVFANKIEDIEEASRQAEETLGNVQKLLSLIASTLNEYVANDTNVQTVYEGYKTDISSARTTINTSLTSLRTTLESYYTALVSVETQTDGYPNNNQNSTIKLKDALIEDAQARVDGIKSQISDAYIISPINGLVTNLEIDEGEVTNTTAPAITVISNGNLEISVNIPEDNIAFVDVGDPALVTLDAYDDLVFEAEVIFISPRAELTDGVPVFEVILEFKTQDPKIKAGLSVDVDIVAEKKEGVISVPSRAVVEKNDERFVRIMVSSDTFRRQPVTLGLKGDDGTIEITKGVSTGDEVIVFIDEMTLKSLKEEIE